MIDERELYALVDQANGPATAHRAVQSVLARGKRLRRRRHAARAAGAGTVVVGLIGTGLFIRGRPAGDADVRAADDPTTTTSGESPTPPPPPPPDCDMDVFVPGEPIAASDVPDEMRVLPGFVPGDAPVTYAAGLRFTTPCPDTAPRPASNALELKADGGDGIVEAEVWVLGPLPRPPFDTMGMSQAPTELRGGPAIRMVPAPTDRLAFAWTEPDGWSWTIYGTNVDETTLRAMAEALVLDSSPEGDEPTASLAPDSVPEGFWVTWQTRGASTPVDMDSTDWNVSFGTTASGEAGMRCELKVSERDSDIPLGESGTIATEHVTVNGQDALWNPVGGMGYLGLGSLTWMVDPDVMATVGCIDQHANGPESIGVETMIQVAESVVPVAADDPRLPG